MCVVRALLVAELQCAFFSVRACWHKLQTTQKPPVKAVGILLEFLLITTDAGFLHFKFVKNRNHATVAHIGQDRVGLYPHPFAASVSVLKLWRWSVADGVPKRIRVCINGENRFAGHGLVKVAQVEKHFLLTKGNCLVAETFVVAVYTCKPIVCVKQTA